MEVAHKYTIKEAELFVFYYEKIILHAKHSNINDSLFAHLKLWYNILGLINNHVEYTFNTEKNNNHAGTRS
jgi:hypothetical protein